MNFFYKKLFLGVVFGFVFFVFISKSQVMARVGLSFGKKQGTKVSNPVFQQQKLQTMVNLMASQIQNKYYQCLAQSTAQATQSILTSLLDGTSNASVLDSLSTGANAFSPGSVGCPAKKPLRTSLACEELGSRSSDDEDDEDEYSEDALDEDHELGSLSSILSSNRQSGLALRCELAKIKAARSKVACATSMMTEMQGLLGDFNTLVDKELERFREDNEVFQIVLKERQAQMEDLKHLLEGGPQGPGLSTLVQNSRDALAKLRQSITGFQDGWQKLQNNEQRLRDKNDQEIATRTVECMNEPQPGFQCESGGASVSLTDYAACTYHTAVLTTPGGRVERNNAALLKLAKSKVSSLKTVLSQIVPSVKSFTGKYVRIKSVRNFVRRYGRTLQRLNVRRFNVFSWLKKAFAKCNHDARRSVYLDRTQRRRPQQEEGGRGLAALQEKIRMAKRALRTQAMNQLEAVGQRMQEIGKGLTQQSAAVNLSACESGGLRVIEGCLKSAKNMLTGMIKGGGGNSQTTVHIQGTQLLPRIDVPCDGLDDCEKKVRNVARNLDREAKWVQTQQVLYAKNARTSTQAAFRSLGGMLSGPSQMMQNITSELQQSLAAVGLPGLKIPPIQAGHLSYEGKPPLPVASPNGMQVLASYVAPAFPDPNQMDLASFQSSLNEKEKEINDQIKEAAKANDKIRKEAEKCLKAIAQSQLRSVGALFKAFQNNHCDLYNKICEEDSSLRDNFNDVVDVVARAQGSFGGGDSDDLTAITGFRNPCLGNPGLKEKIERYAKLKANGKKIKKAIRKFQFRKKWLEKQTEDTQTPEKQLNRLKERKKNLEERITALTNAPQELTAAQGKLTAAKRKLTAAKSKLTAAQKEVDQANKEVASAEKDVKTYNIAVKSLRELASGARSKKNEIKTELKNINSKIGNLEKKLKTKSPSKDTEMAQLVRILNENMSGIFKPNNPFKESGAPESISEYNDALKELRKDIPSGVDPATFLNETKGRNAAGTCAAIAKVVKSRSQQLKDLQKKKRALASVLTGK